jgi:uncharacterized damage-inducible protein DinB
VKRRLSLDGVEATEPEVRSWLGAMEDCRRRTLDTLEGLSEGDLDRASPSNGNSIGTLLYHIAAIEADWLFSEILEGGEPFPEELFPDDDREEGGRLTPVTGVSLSAHVDRLSLVRAKLLGHLRGMDTEEFHRPRSLPDYDVTPVWVLHHLLQHEAEHRAQIAELMIPPTSVRGTGR